MGAPKIVLPDGSTRGMGWLPSPPDPRDHQFLYRAVPLPARVDHREDPAMPPIVDQSRLGSCTANMAAACYEFQANLQNTPTREPRSRLFIYYEERALNGWEATDSGAFIRDAFKVMQKSGAPPERIWPYVIEKFARRPLKKAYSYGLARQEITYEAVPQDALALMTALAQQHLVGIGFSVPTSFLSIGMDGVMLVPRVGEKLIGGHAVCLVGYEREMYWICRNSWGPDWGDHGYFYMPWDFLLDPNWSDDFWLLSMVER